MKEFIAHIDDTENQQYVEEHLQNVSIIAAQIGKPLGMESTMKIIGLFHDLGKFCKKFNDYILQEEKIRRGEVNHTSAGALYLFRHFHDRNKDNEIGLITLQLVTYCILAHHGLLDCLSLEEEKSDYVKRIEGFHYSETQYEEVILNATDFLEEIDVDCLFLQAVQEISVLLQKMSGIKGMEMYFFCGGIFRLALSILIEADRSDTAHFMQNYQQPVYEFEKLCGETEKTFLTFQNYLEERLNILKSNSMASPVIQSLRNEVSNQCFAFASKGTGIYCLSVPTGGGKTLSSFRYALEHARIKKKTKIFYIAPFLSILEQNANEIKEIVKNSDAILEHHSNIDFDFGDCKGIDERYRVLTETWENPIIMTTMVQFLNTLFRGNGSSIRRFHQLSHAVILIDEIQSLPIESICLFNGMMNFISICCNTTVILCSATQPILDLYKIPLKLRYSEPKNMISIENLERQFKRVSIENSCLPAGYTIEKLSDFVLEKFHQSMLVVLNTKKAVRSLYDELELKKANDIVLIQLTTYICPEHRLEIIQEMKQNLKKGKKILCVSTRLIEAGVDISFETVVRSVTGMDSIIQSAGRGNRNGEAKQGILYLVNPDSDVENISKLKDVRVGKSSTVSMLDSYKEEPEAFGFDLLSEKATDIFYQIYFKSRYDEMRYSVKEKDVSLLSLLSTNRKIVNSAYQRGLISEELPPFCFSFQTAGDMYQVISNATVNVLIPYKKAKDEIEGLKEERDLKTMKRKLQKLQRYIVQFYPNDPIFRDLEKKKKILPLGEIAGYYVLSDDSYYSNIGVVRESLSKKNIV